jgi:hypothetical protein
MNGLIVPQTKERPRRPNCSPVAIRNGRNAATDEVNATATGASVACSLNADEAIEGRNRETVDLALM